MFTLIDKCYLSLNQRAISAMNAYEGRDTQLFKALTVSDGWVGGRKGRGRKGCEILSCAQDTVSASIISQQLQQPAMALNKTWPVTRQSWIGEGLIRPHTPYLNIAYRWNTREMQLLSSAMSPWLGRVRFRLNYGQQDLSLVFLAITWDGYQKK